MNENIEGKVVVITGASVALGEWRGGDVLWLRYDVVRSSNQYRPGSFTNRH